MLTLKDYVLSTGLILFLLGFSCLPGGSQGNPKRELSIFNNFADLGAFNSVGGILIAVGLSIVTICVLSVLLATKFCRRTHR